MANLHHPIILSCDARATMNDPAGLIISAIEINLHNLITLAPGVRNGDQSPD